MSGHDGRATAAAHLRSLTELVSSRAIPPGRADEVNELLARAAAIVADGAPHVRDNAEMHHAIFGTEVVDGATMTHFRECFVCGDLSTVPMSMSVARDGAEVVATLTFGSTWEGGIGRVHGGALAAVYDDVLGYHTSLERVPGYLVTMTVDFVAATPTNTPIEYRSRVVERDGRKLRITGESTAAGQVTTRASALVVTVAPDQYVPLEGSP